MPQPNLGVRGRANHRTNLGSGGRVNKNRKARNAGETLTKAYPSEDEKTE